MSSFMTKPKLSPLTGTIFGSSESVAVDSSSVGFSSSNPSFAEGLSSSFSAFSSSSASVSFSLISSFSSSLFSSLSLLSRYPMSKQCAWYNQIKSCNIEEIELFYSVFTYSLFSFYSKFIKIKS